MQRAIPQLIDGIAPGSMPEIETPRDGMAVAVIRALDPKVGQRTGVARGMFEVPDPSVALDEERARAFHGTC